MSTNSDIELSNSDDCEKYVNRFIQEFPLRRAEIGQGTVIKRALPSRHKRMIGAWCFLDHAGPAIFPQGDQDSLMFIFRTNIHTPLNLSSVSLLYKWNSFLTDDKPSAEQSLL